MFAVMTANIGKHEGEGPWAWKCPVLRLARRVSTVARMAIEDEPAKVLLWMFAVVAAHEVPG